MGDSLFMWFFPQWLADLALAHSAIIISPNYRLLPEATTPQIYQDITDFWKYIHSPALTTLLSSQSPPVEIDLSRILTAGDSAGGLLSISSALTYAADVRAAIATYPCVDLVGPEFTTPRKKVPFGQSLPESLYNETLAATQGHAAESSKTAEASLQFMLVAIEHGHLGELYLRGTKNATPAERSMYFPPEALEAEGVSVPRGGITILHGKDDSVVPIESVRRFVKRAKEVVGDEAVRLTEKDGDHGFDLELKHEGWLKDTLKRAVDVWLE